MDMEGLGTEEFVIVGSSNNDATYIAKGKRTKRLRLLSASGVASATVMTSSCSSASGDHVSGGGDYGSFSSTTTTHESTDQEEEDMANCLILLAQGGGGGGGGGGDGHHHHHNQQSEDHDHGDGGGNNNKTENGSSTSSRRFAEMATATATKIGFYIYECKTCNRTFPSFQALGGHRASHKKLKLMKAEEKKPPPAPLPPSPPQPQPITNYDIQFEEAGKPRIKSGPTISLQSGSHSHRAMIHGNKAKIHECSICGSEFTSGQALGGHMRRHRASTNTNTNTSTRVMGMVSGIETSCNTTADAVEVQPRSRNILQLDLNLPAPEDDLRDSKFQFTATQKSMVLSSAPPLVGCHY